MSHLSIYELFKLVALYKFCTVIGLEYVLWTGLNTVWAYAWLNVQSSELIYHSTSHNIRWSESLRLFPSGGIPHILWWVTVVVIAICSRLIGIPNSAELVTCTCTCMTGLCGGEGEGGGYMDSVTPLRHMVQGCDDRGKDRVMLVSLGSPVNLFHAPFVWPIWSSIVFS